MIRNLKILGLAMGALLAFGAVAASSASAQAGALTSDGPVTLTGEDTGEGQNWFEAFGNKVECPGSTYTGHAVMSHTETTEEKTHQLLESGATEVTVTPHYRQVDDEETANCDVNGGELSATVNMNGCDYRFYNFLTNPFGNDEGTYHFLADLVCPPEKEVEVSVYLGHSHGFRVCLLRLPGQTKLAGFHATHTEGTADDIDLTGRTETIQVTEEGLCGHAEESEGKYNVDVTVKGHNEAGNPTAVTITD